MKLTRVQSLVLHMVCPPGSTSRDPRSEHRHHHHHHHYHPKKELLVIRAIQSRTIVQRVPLNLVDKLYSWSWLLPARERGTQELTHPALWT